MSQAQKTKSVMIRKVPLEWIELIKREAEKEGLTVSAFIKIYIIKPWVIRQLEGK